MDHLDMQEDNVCLTQANDEDFYASSDNNTGQSPDNTTLHFQGYLYSLLCFKIWDLEGVES